MEVLQNNFNKYVPVGPLTVESGLVAEDGMSNKEVLILTAISFAVFHFLNRGISSSEVVVAKNASTLSSFVHSVTSSLLVSAALVLNAGLFWNFQMEEVFFSHVGNVARIWSTGYFLSDLYDMLASGVYKKALGLVAHHLACIVSLGAGALCGLYAPIHVLFLAAELNSTFLHLRALFRFSNVDPRSAKWRVNSALFWFTFWTCRMGVSAVIFYILYSYSHLFVANWHVVLAVIGTCVITGANFYLIFQVRNGDRRYLRKYRSAAKDS
mmetsp:Transcript_3584/g.9769  ORF Transcript_3584/g.9769 Transcript_3584/m.9769 type:complete len:268 (+) Transcript_3584:67-870(+)